MIRNLFVAEVQIQGMTGYQVQGMYRACSDSFWETVAHAAVFRDMARAERFLQKCGSRSGWGYDWNHWGRPADCVPHSADYLKKSVPVYSVL
jgi:hypothetical protein